MRARGLGLLVLLALIGGAVGHAWAERASRPDLTGRAAEPVAARDPAVPFTPPEKVNADAELPPLPTSLATHDEQLGRRADGGVRLPVPDTWGRTVLGDAEARWMPPGEPSGGYSLRVAVVDLRRSLEQVVAERAAALPLDGRLTDLEILSQAGDTLRASFILAGYRKLQVTRWVSLDGSGIDLEVSATGRLIDQPGLESLVATIAVRARLLSRSATAATSPAA